MLTFALGLLADASAYAGTPERNLAWDALIGEANAHGGAETRFDRSVSYVFGREDGSYLTFTRLLSGDGRRSVCLVAKDESATACVDWDNGKLTLGDRADSATPWRFRSFKSLEDFEAAQPGLAEELFSAIGALLPADAGKGGAGPGGATRNSHWRASTHGR